MMFSFRRSYLSLWNIWLMLLFGLVFLLFPNIITDGANLYLPIDDMLSTVDLGFRIAGLVLTVWAGIWLLIQRYYSIYKIYDDRLEARHGILRRRTSTANFSHIRSIDVDKSLPGMMLGYGDLLFGTAGTGETNVVFHGIADPEVMKEKIRQLQSPPAQNQVSQPQVSSIDSVVNQPTDSPPAPIAPAPAVEEPPVTADPLMTGAQHSGRPGVNPLPYDADQLNSELNRRLQISPGGNED